MKSRVLSTILLFTASLCCGCDQETSTPSPTLIASGTSIRDLGFVHYLNTPGPDVTSHEIGDALPVITLCDFIRNVGSIAIVEIADEPRIIHSKDDCSGSYSTSAGIFPVNVWAVVAGADLMSRMDIVVLTYGSGLEDRLPVPGEIWMFTLRQSEGQWFPVGSAPIELITDRIAPSQQGLAEFPDTFEELSARANYLLENESIECPTNSRDRFSEEEWHNRHYDPRYYGCVPPEERVPPSQEGPSEECTDTFPCE